MSQSFGYGNYTQQHGIAPVHDDTQKVPSCVSEGEIVDHAMQIVSTRTIALSSAVLTALGSLCRWLSYGCAFVFAGRFYGHYYYCEGISLSESYLRYYRDKGENTFLDSLTFYKVDAVDRQIRNVRQSFHETGVILAATVALWVIGKGLRRAGRMIKPKPKSKQ